MGVKLGTDLARPATQSAFAILLALAAGRPLFTADYYVVDGGSGKVRSFVDQSDPTHLLDQSNSANQCAVPSAEADLGNKLAATFDGVTIRYVSNRAASAWAFLHGAQANFLGAVYGPRSAVNGAFTWLATTSSANAQVGIAMYHSNGAANASQLWKAADGATVLAGSLTPVVTDTPAVATGGRTATVWFAGGSTGAAWRHRNKGAAVASGTSTANAAAGAPSVTLRFGANATETVYMNCRWSMLFCSPNDVQTQFDTYTQATYGVAA